MSHRLTGSRTDLAEAGCMYWARPDVPLPPDTTGAAADEGVRLHALAERYADGRGYHEEDVTPDIAARWSQLAPWLSDWLDATHGAERLVEAAFAVDVHTHRVRGIPRDVGRDYGHSMTEVPARLDLGAVWQDHVEIWDFKTGETAPRADEAGQLKTLALMVCGAFGRTRARVHIVHVRDDAVRTDSADLAQWDLDVHAVTLRRAIDSLPTAEPRPGSHCRWCPARTVCPAIVAAMVAAPSLALDTDDDVARVHFFLKPIEDALAAIKARIKEKVDAAGGIALPNGKHLRIVRNGGGETVDVKALARSVGDDGMQRLREDGVIKPRASGTYVREVS